MRVGLSAALLVCLLCAQDTTVDDLFHKAVDAQQRGDLPEAVNHYRALLRLRPDFFDAEANLAVALIQLGRFDEAVSAYHAALKLQPENKTVRLNLALAFYKKGDFRIAAAELSPLRRSDPDNVRVATLLGDCYLRLGENEQALAAAAPFAKAHPDDLDLAFVLGTAFIANGKLREGVTEVERFAKQRGSADAFLLAGKTRLKLDEYTDARGDLEEAVRLDPSLTGIYTLRGVAREGSGDDKGAESDYRKAIELNRNDFEACVHLGGILYVRRELDAAKPYLEKAVQLDPSSSFALYEMALWKGAMGQVDAAVSDLESVVRKDPKWVQPHIQLAALYFRLRRPEDGLRERQIVDQLSSEQQRTGPVVQRER